MLNRHRQHRGIEGRLAGECIGLLARIDPSDRELDIAAAPFAGDQELQEPSRGRVEALSGEGVCHGRQDSASRVLHEPYTPLGRHGISPRTTARQALGNYPAISDLAF